MQNELQQLLTAIAAERVALIERHEAGARVVSHYDFNNTYQYVIAREETHLTWLQDALAELGAALPRRRRRCRCRRSARPGKKVEPAAFKAVLRGRRAHARRVRRRVAAAGGRHDPRAAPHDAERRARRVARAPAPVRAGGRRLRGSARQAHRRASRAWAACCRRAGWNSGRRAARPDARPRSPSAATSATVEALLRRGADARCAAS